MPTNAATFTYLDAINSAIADVALTVAAFHSDHVSAEARAAINDAVATRLGTLTNFYSTISDDVGLMARVANCFIYLDGDLHAIPGARGVDKQAVANRLGTLRERLHQLHGRVPH